MTQEEKELLLKDLCGRLPYGVICKGVTRDLDSETDKYVDREVSNVLLEIHSYRACYCYLGLVNECEVETVQPYLYPLSSMTDEQRCILEDWNMNEPMLDCSGERQVYVNLNLRILDWLNEHHFDYRGLIEKGLAIDCTGLDIYKEETK